MGLGNSKAAQWKARVLNDCQMSTSTAMWCAFMKSRGERPQSLVAGGGGGGRGLDAASLSDGGGGGSDFQKFQTPKTFQMF